MDAESRKRTEFSVPARAIWDVIADFGGIDEWRPAGS
jgi:hypothetical protein